MNTPVHYAAIVAPKNAKGVQVFNFDSTTSVEVVLINNQPYFVATDICRALKLSNVSEAIKPIDDDEKLTSEILRSGQKRLVWLVSESGMYKLIMRSQDAIRPGTAPHRFCKWVTSEVLPAIRKTGKYSVQPQPQQSSITESDYRQLEMLYRMEKNLREVLQESNRYYRKLCMQQTDQLAARTDQLVKMITGTL